MSKPLAACAAALAALAFAGCADNIGATPEQIVEKRANEYWQAMVKRDFRAAYGYLAPSVRAVSTLQAFAGRFGTAVAWAGAQVKKVSCEPERCTAGITIDALPMLPMPQFRDNPARGAISTYVDETWVREDGQWWLFPKP